MRVLLTRLKKEANTIDGYDVVSTMEELNTLVFPASATHIDCGPILDGISISDRDAALKLIISKLRHNGRMTISGIDIYEIARETTLTNIEIESSIHLLYNNHKSASSINLMIGYLEEAGLSIMNARLQGIEYYISAERNVNRA